MGNNKYLCQKLIKIDGKTYSYWTNKLNNYSQVLVLLSPASCDGSFFNREIDYIPEKTRSNSLIVAPDFPGIGKTGKIKDTSVPAVAKHTLNLLHELNIRECSVLGISYGGAVANELVSLEPGIFNKVILVATGEFFSYSRKIVFNLFFYPLKRSERIQRAYFYLLKKLIKDYQDYSYQKMEFVLNQLSALTKYSLPKNKTFPIPAFVIWLDDDALVTKDSILKIQRIYNETKIYKINIGHTFNLRKEEKKW
jgi:pimeloyl-ACP methyl ester carboxylesterase